MARLARDARLETRNARLKLKQRHEPYWKQVHTGLSIGYRKGPRGGTWYARFLLANGSYKKQSLGIADDYQDANDLDVLNYKQAHRKLLVTADNNAKKAVGVPLGPFTVDDAIKEYLQWYKAHKKSYLSTKQTCETHILPKLEDKRVVDLTAREIRKWHENLAISPAKLRGKNNFRIISDNDVEGMRKRKATANRVLTILKAALNHAWHEGFVLNDEAWRRVRPFSGVDTPKVRFLTQVECKRLINACAPDFRHLVRAALLTGCRYGELIRFQCHDYNHDSVTIHVRESKSGKQRHIPLTDEGKKVFNRLTVGKPGNVLIFTKEDGEPWGVSHQTRPMRAACKKAKINPPASFHLLRHAYGSLLAMEGVQLQIIATVLGHADTRMTERHYAHLCPDYVADTIRANLPEFGSEQDNVVALKVTS